MIHFAPNFLFANLSFLSGNQPGPPDELNEASVVIKESPKSRRFIGLNKMPSHCEAMYILLACLIMLYLVFARRGKGAKRTTLPTDWPVFGMIPGLLLNVRRIHEFVTELLEESGGTFLFRGPPFANMDMLVTADPSNVHYILTKNFQNFGKGPEFKKIFDVLGDGIFIAEAESWENQRRATKSFMNNASFQQFAARTTWKMVETGLVPILDSVSVAGEIVDIQELFQRLGFDCSCLTVLGHDPGSLTKELPHLPHEKAFADAEEAILYRHVVPEVVWKMQKWLQIGTERKMSRAKETVDQFLSKCISLKEESVEQNDEDYDMFTCYKKALADKRDAMKISQQLWKDASLNLVFAGKDTISAALTWFFWLLATNPQQEKKIRQEIMEEEGGKWMFSDMEELKKFVYLHGALCETLRLFPPVALQHKAPIQDDVLPSGHSLKPNTKTLLSFYSMGRMKSIWGEDCHEFKPERWVSDKGTIKIVPSFMFPAFNAGPRSCIGKEISFVELKIVAAAIISRFTIRVAEGHPVSARTSVILHMKHGFKVKVQHSNSSEQEHVL